MYRFTLSVVVFLLLCFSSFSVFAENLTKVIIAKANLENWSDNIEAIGELRANEEVILTANVTETISRIHFNDSQRVEKGAILAEMTSEEESAQVNERIAVHDEASKKFDRVKNLPKTGAVSESLYDQVKKDYEAAKAQLLAVQSKLKDRVIAAPFSGLLGLRDISVGALVTPGDHIVKLTDDSVMKLDFSVPAIYLSSLKTGLKVRATTDSFPGRSFDGVVASIDSEVDSETRSIKVRVKIPNEDYVLRPGILMNVNLFYNPRKSVSIPEESIVKTGSTNYVYTVNPESKLVEKREVEIGSHKSGKSEVIKGIKNGEQVITHGAMKVKEGQKVTVIGVQNEKVTAREILEQVQQ